MAAGGAVPRDRGRCAVPGDTPSTIPAAGIPVDTPQDAAERSRRLAAFEAQRRSDLSSALAALRGLHVRPELDSDRAGRYMRNAIEHGGYRAALEYYGSDEAKASHTEQYLFRIRGWLLGRLGLYDQVTGWLEEAATLPTSDHFLDDYGSCTRTAYRTPSMWLETPRPVPRSADGILTLEPVAAACPDTGVVPDYIWNTMLILDAAGPICSHACLGAATFLVAAEPGCRTRGSARGDLRYDPLRGARLHGAPEGCHRWIIADIDFDPRTDGPHYYYDLTDEGKRMMDAARAAGAPWPQAAEAAATGLEGMALPDLLETACRFAGPPQDLAKMRNSLGDILDVWQKQEDGLPAPPVGAGDRALVDLGAIASRPDSKCATESAQEHLLCLMAAIKSAHAIAGGAEPSSRAEGAVLEALIVALRELCRKKARAAVAEVLAAQDPARREGGESPLPMYTDVTMALICDLHYCLGEYSERRGLAVDPCNVKLSEQFTKAEKAEIVEALTRGHPLYSMWVDRGVAEDTGVIRRHLGDVDTSRVDAAAAAVAAATWYYIDT